MHLVTTRLRTCAGLLGGWLALGGCVDRYTPDVPTTAQANLVVDGFINPQGTTSIRLSRTFSVNTKSSAPAETKARVAIADDRGQRYTLAENPTGTYTSAALALDPSQQYQLLITTAQGREYASDKQPVVLTPPIDSLSWKPNGQNGVQLYLTTHAASTAARHYRWEYAETWEFTSARKSELEYVASTNTIERRPSTHQIFTCWRTESSTAILQGNTTQFGQNTLASHPLLPVPPSSKLHYGYSILVRQYAETPAEYDYWERLRKSTENLGTVNDPLPARVTGNVHALADATEPVLGYVGVHSVAERRLFIDAAQLPAPLPNSILYDAFYASCGRLDSLRPSLMLALCKLGNDVPVNTIPAIALYDTSVPVLFYRYGSVACVDCRQRGSAAKPSFWPK